MTRPTAPSRTLFSLDVAACSCRQPPSAATLAAARSARTFAAAPAAPVAAPAPTPAPEPAPAAQPPVRWSGVLAVEGELTGDGRLIERNALQWDLANTVPLKYTPADFGGHDGAVVVGRVDSIERGPGGKILATGVFDTGSEHGREAVRLVTPDASGRALMDGVSLELDDVSFEVRVAAEVLDEMGLLDIGGPPVDADEDPACPDCGETPELETDADGRVTVLEVTSGEEVDVTTSARIRAATLVSVPAFASAMIALDFAADAAPTPPAQDGGGGGGMMPDGTTSCSCTEGEADYDPECLCGDQSVAASALVAAAGPPVEPPSAWFAPPRLTRPTPLTITDEGQMYGHAVLWEACHIGYSGRCVHPPHSASGYRNFHLGALRTAEGAEVPVGHVTFQTGHAGDRLDPTSTLAHYDHTGAVGADVVVGEDEYGIWVAGALRPGISPLALRVLRSAPLSPDWRRINGSLELVALLSVNVPGMGVPRPSGFVHAGKLQSLVAAGMLLPAAAQTGEVHPDPLVLARRVRASTLTVRAHRRRVASSQRKAG